MSEQTVEPVRLSPSELRTLFLFEKLDDDQLAWLSDNGYCQTWSGGQSVYNEGDPATCLFVLVSGTMSMHRRVENTEVETARTNQRGVYSGATQSFVKGMSEVPYWGSARAVTDCDFWVINAEDFGEKFREWFPMAMHLLEGLTMGFRSSQAIIGQRERLLSLGRLSAGLTHELNNPAAANARAVDALGDTCDMLLSSLTQLAERALSAEQFIALDGMRRELDATAAVADSLVTMDREDALTDWLETRGIEGAWRIAPALAAAEVDTDWCERAAASLEDGHLEPAFGWVASALSARALLAEIKDSTSRISALLNDFKSYSQLDRADAQTIDVTNGLDDTLVMLKHKLTDGVTIRREYGNDLPKIDAFPAELNQVWTNLIANAIDAVDGHGTIRIRTRAETEFVVVEIVDDGPGMPPDVQARAFEPFFTTKDVGKGTGLGLDISRRIIADRHHGQIIISSEPGNTVIQVRVPRAASD